MPSFASKCAAQFLRPHTNYFTLFPFCQELDFPGRELEAMAFACAWTQISAGPLLDTSGFEFSVPAQTVTIVNNANDEHTRMPSCEHTHNAQSLAVPRAVHARERAPSLALRVCQD